MSSETTSQFKPAASSSAARRKFPAIHILLLLVIAGCMFFIALGRMPLIEPDEGRNAEVSREMLVKGDWITPHYDNFSYLDKPPVFFWEVAASFKVGGVTEASARFPSALAALLTVFLTWFLARRLFDDLTGLYAGIVLATSPLVVIFAREVIFDMTLTLFVTAAMICYWLREAGTEQRKLLDVLFFGAMGFATLTKGPVGFLLPMLSIVLYQLLRGKFSRLKDLNWGLGLLTFFGVVLPWFIPVSVQHPDFPGYAFLNESLERFATGHAHRSGPVYYYLIIFLAGFLPWSFFLLYSTFHRSRRWKEFRQDRHAPVLYLLSWVGLIFVFFTISQSKLPGYFLPAMVPLSILMAKVWAGPKPERQEKAPDWLTGGFATMIALGIIVAIVPHYEHFLFPHGKLGRKMPHDVLALIGPTFLYTGILLGALGIIGRNLCSRAREKAPTVLMFAVVACTFPIMLVRWFHPLKLYASADSSRALARQILDSPQRNLPIYGYYYFRTSLPFYLRRPVGLISSTADALTSNYVVMRWPTIRKEAQEGRLPKALAPPATDGMPLIMGENEWMARRGTVPTLVLVRNYQARQLANSVPQMIPLWTGWKYSVWEIPADKVQPSAPKKRSRTTG